MTYLLDTDVVANWLKGRSHETTLLRQLGPSGLVISLITYGEIYDGIYYGRDPQGNEQIFSQFLRGVDVLPLTQVIMRRFAQIRGHLRRTGNIIDEMAPQPQESLHSPCLLPCLVTPANKTQVARVKYYAFI
jgi:predicted nucleic acid-binding protein